MSFYELWTGPLTIPVIEILHILLLIKYRAWLYTALQNEVFSHLDKKYLRPYVKQTKQVRKLSISFDAHCCHRGTAIKHPVPDRVKLSFVIFDI